MHVINNLKPIYNKNSKILILGAMPSVISRKENFYYANKTNRFWKVFEVIFHVKLTTTLEKIRFLSYHNIALWDIIKECDIVGSSDSSIKNVITNDIKNMLTKSNINYIFTTGKIAYNYYNKFLKSIIKKDAIYLPSPSSANAAFSLNDLVNEYKIILKYLNH